MSTQEEEPIAKKQQMTEEEPIVQKEQPSAPPPMEEKEPVAPIAEEEAKEPAAPKEEEKKEEAPITEEEPTPSSSPKEEEPRIMETDRLSAFVEGIEKKRTHRSLSDTKQIIGEDKIEHTPKEEEKGEPIHEVVFTDGKCPTDAPSEICARYSKEEGEEEKKTIVAGGCNTHSFEGEVPATQPMD